MYKEILASIRLDSPTSLQETRDNVMREGQVAQLVNTPVLNSAASLMVMGQHVLTLGKGEFENTGVNPH